MLQKGSRDIAKRSDQPVEPWRRGLSSPFAEMDRLFDEVFKRPFFSLMSSRPGSGAELYTPVDMYEDGESIVVKAEIPGLKKEDIEVQLTPESITISGHKGSEEKVEEKNFLRVERSYGSFSRTLEFPVETMVDKARATFKDGILEVRIPKSESATQRVKKINIE